MLHFSRAIHHMIVIYGANVLNDIARCFFNFKILIFRLVKRLKGQKMAQSDKNSCLLHFIFQEPCIIYLHLWYTCIYKRIIYPGIFFIFFFWFLGSLGGGGVVKGWKVAQNDKKLCLSHSVSQEPYIIWLWYMVHMCEMMISPEKNFIFQNFDFWGF